MTTRNDLTAAETDRPSPAPSRCDNYEQFLEDTYGYAYSARDIVSTDALERHDRLASEASADELAEINRDLDDFERLGLARGYLRTGELEAFADELDNLLDSEDVHPAITYSELPLLAAEVLTDHDRFDRALDYLERAIERWPDHSIAARRQRALVVLHADGPDAARSHYERLADNHPDDPELRFEFAEDLHAHGHPELARTWLQRARSTAERVGDRALLVDLELLKTRLAE